MKTIAQYINLATILNMAMYETFNISPWYHGQSNRRKKRNSTYTKHGYPKPIKPIEIEKYGRVY